MTEHTNEDSYLKEVRAAMLVYTLMQAVGDLIKHQPNLSEWDVIDLQLSYEQLGKLVLALKRPLEQVA